MKTTCLSLDARAQHSNSQAIRIVSGESNDHELLVLSHHTLSQEENNKMKSKELGKYQME